MFVYKALVSHRFNWDMKWIFKHTTMENKQEIRTWEVYVYFIKGKKPFTLDVKNFFITDIIRRKLCCL